MNRNIYSVNTFSQNQSINYFECFIGAQKNDKSPCKVQELREHLKEHLEEVKCIDIEYLKNGNETFLCNICTFNSNYVDKIKEHLVNHIRNDHRSVKAFD